MKFNPEQYQTVIVYGIGQYYERIKETLFQHVKPDYLCDRKWEDSELDSYDGIPIINRKKLSQLEHSLIIIATCGELISASVKSDLEGLASADIVHVDSIIGESKSITGKKLKEICSEDGAYRDEHGNRIYFDETIPDSIVIYFEGKSNVLTIGKNVTVGKLTVRFGSEGVCSIGDGTIINGGYFAVSGAALTIGKDCLLSWELVIRTHDDHHIFDADTHERLNYSKDVTIGDHVWICYRASVLAGARIGRGSVVGAGAYTSGQFGAHQLIAGCPAKVIREHVCWSKDSTELFSHDFLGECVYQEALKYL